MRESWSDANDPGDPVRIVAAYAAQEVLDQVLQLSEVHPDDLGALVGALEQIARRDSEALEAVRALSYQRQARRAVPVISRRKRRLIEEQEQAEIEAQAALRKQRKKRRVRS